MDDDWLHLQQIKMQPPSLSQLHAVTVSLIWRRGAERKLHIKYTFVVAVCLRVCIFQENSWTGTQIRELHARMLVRVMEINLLLSLSYFITMQRVISLLPPHL